MQRGHDPHATDNDFRLNKPIVELCTTCHRGFDDGYHVVQRPQGGGHPIGGRDDPLRPGRELVCTSCHDPHGTYGASDTDYKQNEFGETGTYTPLEVHTRGMLRKFPVYWLSDGLPPGGDGDSDYPSDPLCGECHL